jgi:hypothetical protein
MKPKLDRGRKTRDGYAIVLAMVFAGLSLLLLASTMRWNWSGTRITERNNTYNRAINAAEAGTEAVIAGLDRDFLNQSIDFANLDPYRRITPRVYVTDSWINDYSYSDTNGTLNTSTVESPGPYLSTNMDPRLPGLYGTKFPCRVISVAKRINTAGYDVAAAVQQDFDLDSIPIYQFQAFYSLDLEINPGADMKIGGKVHGNADMYLAPGVGLEFLDAVETVGKINLTRSPDDPSYGAAKVDPVFDSTHSGKANSLSLPIGTNNSPSEVVKVLDPPPAYESPASPLGSQRFYNKADLIVTTDPKGIVTVRAGRWNGLNALFPDVTNTPPTYSFVSTNVSFGDQREGKNTQTTEIDVGLFNTWLTNAGLALNTLALANLGHEINSIYVDDQRLDVNKLTAVRVANGKDLPGDGLTVATYLPLYVKGHFNAPDLAAGSTNTLNTKPASLAGDSITVLSANWSDANSFTSVYTDRPATDTTINAAFLAGIVATTNIGGTKHYSGGLENFPRLLENWGGKTFTYNGSMVVMFPSRYARSWFVSPGTYYSAAIRKWSFDRNFLNQGKLPPITPAVRKIVRGQWTVIAAKAP